MIITQITVSFGETQSLPEYCNVKPSMSITAEVSIDEDPWFVECELWQKAKDAVQAQVDLALEAAGMPAKYSAVPRFKLVRTVERRYGQEQQFIALVPNDFNTKQYKHLSDYFSLDSATKNMRVEQARRKLEWLAREFGASALDCSDGNLELLEEHYIELQIELDRSDSPSPLDNF